MHDLGLYPINQAIAASVKTSYAMLQQRDLRYLTVHHLHSIGYQIWLDHSSIILRGIMKCQAVLDDMRRVAHLDSSSGSLGNTMIPTKTWHKDIGDVSLLEFCLEVMRG